MKIFFVTSGDWKKTVTADSYMEAATVAVEKIFKSAQDCSFGAVIGVIEQKFFKEKNMDQMRYIYGPAVLANAGQYKFARQLEKKIDEMKKYL